MQKKNFSSGKGFKLIVLAALLHLLGIVSSLLRAKSEVPFRLPFHLLRFFAGWSVHASILTILAVILIGRERKYKSLPLKKRKILSYSSQLFTFVATIYNLVTFGFILTHFLIGALKSYGFWLDLQLFSGHFAAPFLTIFYFYYFAPIDLLLKKLIKTLSLSFICPLFYFFYVGILAKINVDKTSSLYPYMEKYPYFIFEGIVEREGKWFIINFLIALLAYLFICFMVILTKLLTKSGKVKKSILSLFFK